MAPLEKSAARKRSRAHSHTVGVEKVGSAELVFSRLSEGREEPVTGLSFSGSEGEADTPCDICGEATNCRKVKVHPGEMCAEPGKGGRVRSETGDW